MQVLGGRGSDLERSFSYGVVRQLFEPLLASLQAEERADLFAGSAALAAPLFDPAQLAADSAADSSLATLHGLYWLTASLAARRPLLLALDVRLSDRRARDRLGHAKGMGCEVGRGGPQADQPLAGRALRLVGDYDYSVVTPPTPLRAIVPA